MGSQCPGLDPAAVARVLGVKPEQVKLNTLMAGGGFGRRFASTSDFVFEAGEIAKAGRAAGRRAGAQAVEPRGRHEGRLLPAHALAPRGVGFDERRKVLAWKHAIVGQSIITGTVFGDSR